MRPVPENVICRNMQESTDLCISFTLFLCICWYVSVGVDTRVHGVFDSDSADTQAIQTEFSRGIPQAQQGKYYPRNGGSRLPCCQTLVSVYESTHCYITEPEIVMLKTCILDNI
jgi:hypothetical protein